MTMAQELSSLSLMSTSSSTASIGNVNKRGSLASPYHGQLGGFRTACRGSSSLHSPNSSSASLMSKVGREKRASLHGINLNNSLQAVNGLKSPKQSTNSLGSLGQRSRTSTMSTMVSFQEDVNCDLVEANNTKNAIFGTTSPASSSSSLNSQIKNKLGMSKKPITRNGKSFSFPLDKSSASSLKSSLSMAKLEDMRNAVIGGVGAVGKGTKQMGNAVFEGGKHMGKGTLQVGNAVIGGVGNTLLSATSTTRAALSSNSTGSPTNSNHERNLPRASISSQALWGIKKIVSSNEIRNMTNSRSSPRDCDPEVTQAFFELINLNPSDPAQREQLNEREIKRIIRRHPELLSVKYDFPVGGRGKLTVSRYPLPALVALGASLSLIKMVVKSNPFALEASKDFGSTVMHTACSFDTDMEVVEYLYNKHPEAVEETTKLVFLPLHNACAKSNPSLEMIQFLVHVYPEGLLAINKLGDTPLRTAQRNKSVSNEVLEFLQEQTKQISSLEENQELWMEVSERQSWGSAHTRRSMMEAIAAAATKATTDDHQDPDMSFSFAVSSAHNIPKKSSHSEALSESTYDMSASFAEASYSSFSKLAEQSFHKIAEESVSQLSSQLLAMNP